ncbi:MAG: hypothetical protein BWX71_02463 [Deltaproteobacteria bacterium ADurb.Bin072]|nr:MAG: hypothetical protein BWX71_02463 [Deltaproteobacteria bacterium ADurb.Bin072]
MVMVEGRRDLASLMMRWASSWFMVTLPAPTTSGLKASRTFLSFSGVYLLTMKSKMRTVAPAASHAAAAYARPSGGDGASSRG